MDAAGEKTETLYDESNLEGEDFFSRLTDEEKECLQYLLETIDSLDQDEDENANNDPDTNEQLRSTGLQELDRSVKQSDKTEHGPSTTSKMKIIKSFSEDGPGLSITVTPDTGQKTTSSHPSHLRKFDTIMRSGVNVQELRARFIHQQGKTFDDTSKGTETSLASKQLPQVARNLSPRQEALQKLGLLKINQSNTNTPEELHGTDQTTPVKNYEINQNHSKAGVNLPRVFERKPGAFDKVWPP
ncbi:uncharacterized protein RB166_017284 isoform 1-T2 [Leptodactylus fuscus]|uniref:uncharacterized protein LOC142218225 n=1 Tax=Leptodactylus fuscus TaxID=238119 RepID=UPI003F4E4AE0